MSDFYLENVKQNDFKKIYRAKHVLSRVEGTPSTQRKNLCHFDRREKSLFRAKGEIFFSDPSHSLGMMGLGPSPWRPLRLRSGHALRLCAKRSVSNIFSKFHTAEK